MALPLKLLATTEGEHAALLQAIAQQFSRKLIDKARVRIHLVWYSVFQTPKLGPSNQPRGYWMTKWAISLSRKCLWSVANGLN